MEIKQHIFKQPIIQRRNHKGNKMCRDKWNQKHDIPKLTWCSESSTGGKCIAINAYVKKQEKTSFPGSSVAENPAANARDLGSIPDPGRSHMPRSN